MKDIFGKNILNLSEKKLWLFDMDGTVYLGNKLFDGAIKLFDNITKKNEKFIFITNNSSKSIKEYLKKVRKMGIKANKNNFYTSIDASSSLLKEKFGKKLIYAQGTKSFIRNLKKSQLNVTCKYNEKAVCVLVGFDTELNMKKLVSTCKMLKNDIPFYATNPDWVCPTEDGFIPDCGSMCFSIEKATGKKPIFIGKPNSLMIEEAIKKENVKKNDVLILGDRIYTDIASGVNANVDTVLVLSGETTVEMLNESNIKPTYTIKNISELNKIFN